MIETLFVKLSYYSREISKLLEMEEILGLYLKI